MDDFTTTCPACDRACPVSVDHIRAWAIDDDRLDDGEHTKDVVADRAMPVTCAGCDTTFWIDITVVTSGPAGTVKEQVPSLPVGSAVRVCNEQHPLTGKTGQIVERRHLHYRVSLSIGTVWLPEHWVTLVARLNEAENGEQ
jgi:hypothetical protein